VGFVECLLIARSVRARRLGAPAIRVSPGPPAGHGVSGIVIALCLITWVVIGVASFFVRNPWYSTWRTSPWGVRSRRLWV